MREFGEPVAEVAVNRIGAPYAWTFRGRRYTGGLVDHWVTHRDEHWLLQASSRVGEGLAELARTGEVWELVAMGRPAALADDPDPSDDRSTSRSGQRWQSPLMCPYGHELSPGRVLHGWRPCTCPSAAACYGGHCIAQCLACEKERTRTIFYRPPHLPADGARARHPLDIPRGTTPPDRGRRDGPRDG